MSNYLRASQDQDGEQLHWPGGPNGFPFRGQRPGSLRDEEYENLKPVSKVRCRLFRLEDPRDLAEYAIIRAQCANRLFIPLDRDRVWDEKAGNYRVFLEWLEPAYEVPEGHSDINPSGVTNDAIASYTRQSGGFSSVLTPDRLAGFAAPENGY